MVQSVTHCVADDCPSPFWTRMEGMQSEWLGGVYMQPKNDKKFICVHFVVSPSTVWCHHKIIVIIWCIMIKSLIVGIF